MFLSYLQSHSTFIRYPNANPFSQECSCSTFRSYITCISHTCFHFSLRHSKTSPCPCAYCIGRQLSSPCPFLASTFAPTRRRLACYIHLHSVITSFRFIPQPHTPLHHFATLMVSFRFPNAGSRLFFLFWIMGIGLKIFKQNNSFFNTFENDFLLAL